MKRTEEEQSVRIQAVKTTFEIIETLLETEGARLTDVANRLKKPKSTIFDYLQTLEWLGYIVKRGTTYRVSTRFLDIGLQVRNQLELAQVAKSELHKLADETGEYASLMIIENNQGVIIDTVGSEEATDIGLRPGTCVPLHASAGGKAILARLAVEQVQSIIDDYGLPRLTENTVTNSSELFDELQEIRDTGYATNQSERRRGTYGIAAPIQEEGNVVGAITVYGPAHHIEELAEGPFVKKILRSVNIIEVTLAYS